MKRSDAIRMHLEEAATLTRLADSFPEGRAVPELRAQARDHESMADAARHYEYEIDLDD